ncbi:hypothetical protein [Gemmobacter sp. 24YEA27]|uniref:hypothetical protein n=1 Tax=Gemmobacter sp. 24YEA27 TaxID=3040672 RepID=UPI0024B3AE24|nr:hypothetical protein [Gemmobacter sp. 24YEA27]
MIEVIVAFLALPTGLKFILILAAMLTVKRFEWANGDAERIWRSRPFKVMVLGFYCTLAAVMLIAIVSKFVGWSPATVLLVAVSLAQATIAWLECPISDPVFLDENGDKLVMAYQSERAKVHSIKYPRAPRKCFYVWLAEVATLLLIWLMPDLLRPF